MGAKPDPARAMAEQRIQPEYRPASRAELAVLFQEQAGHFDRVAVIEPTPEFLPAIEYAAIFGQGPGINVRVFSARREAERWLRYGSPDD